METFLINCSLNSKGNQQLMKIIEVNREEIWKYRQVCKVIKTNNGKVTKFEPTNAYIKKNNIKKLDFKKYCVEPLFVHKLFKDNDDYIKLTLFKLQGEIFCMN